MQYLKVIAEGGWKYIAIEEAPIYANDLQFLLFNDIYDEIEMTKAIDTQVNINSATPLSINESDK